MADLSKILNWRRWSENISLSGQPTEQQLADIKQSGVSTIINLGPHSNKGALPDEAGTVAGLGMRYEYIPVDFENPTTDDYETFCETLDHLGDEQIHVHCIYNARVSAFFYRYAKDGKGGSKADAFALMDGIWRPGGVWATFIYDEKSQNLANRYAGHDY